MVLAAPRSQRTNTALVFERGNLIYRYDKIHLFRPAGDHRYFLPGKTIGTFRFGVGRKKVRAGLAICFDLRFPELVRAMAIRGMQILCVPSRWPEARDDAWQALLRARAIENQVFVLGCNAIGPEGGYSYAFDPMGNMLFSNRGYPESQLCTFNLDLHRLAGARRLYNAIREAIVLKQSRIPRVLAHRLPAGR
jgi:predicted amidohydrolase